MGSAARYLPQCRRWRRRQLFHGWGYFCYAEALQKSGEPRSAFSLFLYIETANDLNYIQIMSENKKTIQEKKNAPPVTQDFAVAPRKTPSGGEVWLFTAGGRVVNVTTSNSSASIMDDALKIYSPALERLAKR